MTETKTEDTQQEKHTVYDFDPKEAQKIVDYITKDSRSDLSFIEVQHILDILRSLVESSIRNINTLHSINGDPPKTA